jgi:hypothetical protein
MIPKTGGKSSTADVKTVKPATDVPASNTSDNTVKESSFGRKVIICVLVVIIIVLLILLIYQIYKYYSVDEIPLDPSRPPDRSNNSGAPPHSNNSSKPDNSSSASSKPPSSQMQTGGTIPENVRNMDNDVLSQFVQKVKNSKTQRETVDKQIAARPRVSEHQASLASIPEANEKDEMRRIEKIIDSARHAQIEVTDDGSDDEMPSRDDILRQMQRDMSNEKQRIEDVEAFTGATDSIIDDFQQLSNAELLESADTPDVCQYTLTKGANAGNSCGRRLSTADRCSRHKDK